MKVFIAVLSVITAILAVLYFSARQAARQQVAAAQTAATAASNDVVTARHELDDTRGQLAQIQQSAAEERDRSQQLLETLTNQLASAQIEVERKQARIDELEKKNAALDSEIGVVSGQLRDVEQKLAALDATHRDTVGNLVAMREDYVKLTKEKTALEAKLHDLKALREQVRAVKAELHAQKVAERQRLDRAATALGNGGFMMKEGAWVSMPRPRTGKYPISQEIGREPAAPTNP